MYVFYLCIEYPLIAVDGITETKRLRISCDDDDDDDDDDNDDDGSEFSGVERTGSACERV